VHCHCCVICLFLCLSVSFFSICVFSTFMVNKLNIHNVLITVTGVLSVGQDVAVVEDV